MNATELKTYLAARKELVDAALARYIDDPALDMPAQLREAMRYSLMAGGKRVRPVLVMAGAEAVGGDPAQVMPCACALEVIHTFSLVHDDLPAMDDDDLRRGQPTNHKVFGEGMAILAGDGLLAHAFWCLTDPALQRVVPAPTLVAVIREIADATGACGMVGGQVLDILAEHQELTPADVERLHNHKTGALIRASVVSGARLGGGDDAAIDALTRYGNAVGLAFQIADDLLSLESTAETLGKPVGNDIEREKATYPAMAGVEAARERMQGLTAEALEAIVPLGIAATPLRALAEYITARKS